MKVKAALSKFSGWLMTTEMFARPSKQLPGKWELFEYYVDVEEDLLNCKEEDLKIKKENWTIEFADREKFIQQGNLSVGLISGIENGIWSISRNFVTIINPTDFRKNVEFQFAIQKKNLRLLKKDDFGKIEFFGFFRKLEK
ncbi:MAG: hypothetical protein JXR61_09000 [Prolixibacteraceae bacterium]|nr:hypothetical protein [Prolixibacteraceae bacterium]